MRRKTVLRLHDTSMSIGVGTRVGSLEITALLGKGGMGEVYRARDLKLKREVAIKILPEEFSRDGDRVSRFQREAEVLASLNHPNIGAIYDLQEADGSRFLVLELVEGETLAERIARGPVPLEEALDVARQICDALEAAHEKGVVHRDLKPANVKISPDGKVKVLDFGLAKAMENAPATTPLSNSPTMLSGTMGGMILGTAAYMSPEQAKGRPADKRSDVWAFGCLLYEMLAGKNAFEGEDVSETLAAVLRAEPDWRALPAQIPASLGALIQRCLKKDRRQRPGDVAVVLFVLDELATSSTSASSGNGGSKEIPLWRHVIVAFALFVLGAALASAAWWVLRPVGRPPVTRFTITLPVDQQFSSLGRQILAMSPDGTQMVYVANRRLYLRSMSDLQARAIQGTEGFFVAYPAFSPDGGSVAFLQFSSSAPTGVIKRIGTNGGAAVTVCEVTSVNGLLGLTWEPHGILFGDPDKGIMRVLPSGGKAEVLVSLKNGEAASRPQMLPDGHTLLFTYSAGGLAPDRWDKAQIVVQSLDTGQRKTIVEVGTEGRYLPSGHLVYAVSGVLFAVPFDARRHQTTGPAVSVVEGVVRGTGPYAGAHAVYTVSDNGTLAYVPGPASISSAQREVNLIDRTGVSEPLKLPSATYEAPRVSPDGTRIVVGSDDGKEATVWVYDLSQTHAPLKLTFGGRNRLPIWSHDGKYVAFQSDRDGDGGLFRQLADGTGPVERLTKPDPGTTHVPNAWSSDGRTLLLDVVKDSAFSLSTWSSSDKKVVAFAGVPPSSRATTAVFSPDGRWVAYTIRPGESGRNAVYVQPFPPTGSKYQISRDDDGHHPLWSPDGKQLLYNPGSGPVSVSVTTQPSFSFGIPEPVPGRELVNVGPGNARSYDFTPDGKYMIGVASVVRNAQGGNPRINVALNWFRELQERVPVK
jgi:serine/threonine-protein kinase